MNTVMTRGQTVCIAASALRRGLGRLHAAWLALAVSGLIASATPVAAVSPSDAPGYGLAPVCAMAHCEGDFPEASVPILNTAGAGQGARIASGASRPVSLRLSDGSYQCRRIINNCGGDVFIPANSPTEWNSFVNGHPSCIGIVACNYMESLGPWASWTASCGPAVRQRWIGCQRDDTHYVSANFCAGRTLDQEATCFPCPTTSCGPTSDGGTICTSDDRCGNVSSTYTPPTNQGQYCPDGTPMPGNGICSSNPPTSTGACIGTWFVPGPGTVPINLSDRQFFWVGVGNQGASGSDATEWYGDIVQCNGGSVSVAASWIVGAGQEAWSLALTPWNPGSKQGCSGMINVLQPSSQGNYIHVTVPYSISHGNYVDGDNGKYMCWNGSLTLFGRSIN